MLNVLNRAIEKILLNWGRPLEKLLSGGGGGGGRGEAFSLHEFVFGRLYEHAHDCTEFWYM